MSSRSALIRALQMSALLSLIGLFVALYLWLYKIGVIGTLQCGTGGCEQVQTSRYAVLWGVPVAFYGVCGFGLLFAVSLLGLHPEFANQRGVLVLLLSFSSVGVVFVGYLTSLELFVIHAICRWCVAAAALVMLIWATNLAAYWRLKLEGNPPARLGRAAPARVTERRSWT